MATLTWLLSWWRWWWCDRCVVSLSLAHTHIHTLSQNPLFFVRWLVLLAMQQSTKPTNIVKHWYKQENKRFTAAMSCCCCSTAQRTHIQFNSHGARKSIVYGNQFQFDEIIIFYTVENGNLIFSGVLSSCSPLHHSSSVSLTSNHFSLTPRRLYLWGESYVYIATPSMPFLHGEQTMSSVPNFPSNRTPNTHSSTYTWAMWHSQSHTDKMSNNKKSTHWFKYDQMLVLKLCR